MLATLATVIGDSLPASALATYPAQFGHDAVSFDAPCWGTSFILAPQDAQSKTVGAVARRLTVSTTSGFFRAWLKSIRGSKLRFRSSFPISLILQGASMLRVCPAAHPRGAARYGVASRIAGNGRELQPLTVPPRSAELSTRFQNRKRIENFETPELKCKEALPERRAP
jgi:hypothetical protein